MRLDDAAEKMDLEKWNRMEKLLDEYNIKPLVGVIPNCKDPMMDCYEKDECFWNRVKNWENKGWTIALHGYEHVYCTEKEGLNPVNRRSEFAGLGLDEQKRKIREGVAIFKENGVDPKVFFAPSHTFDLNTIEALKEESDIEIISDTIAYKQYTEYGMTFVPQQSGMVRTLPFGLVTFCYHPNIMNDSDFDRLRIFMEKHSCSFVQFPLFKTLRKKGLIDEFLKFLYFARR